MGGWVAGSNENITNSAPNWGPYSHFCFCLTLGLYSSILAPIGLFLWIMVKTKIFNYAYKYQQLPFWNFLDFLIFWYNAIFGPFWAVKGFFGKWGVVRRPLWGCCKHTIPIFVLEVLLYSYSFMQFEFVVGGGFLDDYQVSFTL